MELLPVAGKSSSAGSYYGYNAFPPHPTIVRRKHTLFAFLLCKHRPVLSRHGRPDCIILRPSFSKRPVRLLFRLAFRASRSIRYSLFYLVLREDSMIGGQIPYFNILFREQKPLPVPLGELEGIVAQE